MLSGPLQPRSAISLVEHHGNRDGNNFDHEMFMDPTIVPTIVRWEQHGTTIMDLCFACFRVSPNLKTQSQLFKDRPVVVACCSLGEKD